MNDETIPAKPLPKMTPGAEHYWQSATRGQLVLPHCRVCDKVFFYPRIWCPHCFSHELDWRDASGRGDHNFTMFAQLCAIAADLIGAHAEERVRQALLPALAAGDTLVAFGLTEPDAGSDAAAIKARAHLDGDEWVVSGEKAIDHDGGVRGLLCRIRAHGKCRGEGHRCPHRAARCARCHAPCVRQRRRQAEPPRLALLRWRSRAARSPARRGYRRLCAGDGSLRL